MSSATPGRGKAASEGGGGRATRASNQAGPGGAAPGYRAALEGAAFLRRHDRRRFLVGGRAPGRMLAGMVSGRLPAPPIQDGDGRWRGRAEPSALLDAKGRMLSELRLLSVPSLEERFLLDLPRAGGEEALGHLRKFLPPRFAAMEEVTERSAHLAVLGPGAPALVALGLLCDVAGPGELEALAEGEALMHRDPRAPEGSDIVTVLRGGEVAAPVWELLFPAPDAPALERALVEAGAEAASAEAWRSLRLEAGRPEYGVDMDASTIPVEAGIQGRVVDYAKGCFTGQEVLIRIRDRGRVNRHLRGLRLGVVEPPATGTNLFRAGEEKSVGHLTSSAPSPRFGEVIGLGWVRREVVPPAELRLGAPDGPPVGVHDLETDWRP